MKKVTSFLIVILFLLVGCTSNSILSKSKAQDYLEKNNFEVEIYDKTDTIIGKSKSDGIVSLYYGQNANIFFNSSIESFGKNSLVEVKNQEDEKVYMTFDDDQGIPAVFILKNESVLSIISFKDMISAKKIAQDLKFLDRDTTEEINKKQ